MCPIKSINAERVSSINSSLYGTYFLRWGVKVDRALLLVGTLMLSVSFYACLPLGENPFRKAFLGAWSHQHQPA